MKLLRSLQAFREVCREDRAFRRLGRPFGWSVGFHYLGRWHQRRGGTMPVRDVDFSFAERRMVFGLNEAYLGAFKGVFLDREYDCAAQFERPPRRIIDLGGNVGFGAVFLDRIFPGSQFAVVEPDPRNLPLLRRNLDRNRVSARIIAGAIGDAPGRLALRFGANPTCSSLAGTGMHDLAETVEVEVTTVPAVLEKLGWSGVDLLKIDIERAEETLLAGNNAWLERVGAILVEIHPNTTVERLNGYLAPYGFTLRRFGAGREPVYFAQRAAR